MPLTAHDDAAASLRPMRTSSPTMAEARPLSDAEGAIARNAAPIAEPQAKAIDKRSLDYIVRSGIAGGFAGCAVSEARSWVKCTS